MTNVEEVRVLKKLSYVKLGMDYGEIRELVDLIGKNITKKEAKKIYKAIVPKVVRDKLKE